ncbi:MAG: NAD(P)H-binding protein [Gemmatimonadaceae bacterium]
MHLVVFGAGGNIGQHIVSEALNRQHRVTAAVRDDATILPQHNLDVVEADATQSNSVAQVSSGVDAIVSAISPRPGQDGRPASSLTTAAAALIEGARTSGVKRLIIVGGAGSLELVPGQQLVDQPDFPDAYKPEALAQRDALAVYRGSAGDLDWTYISPAAEIRPGRRTGEYRISGDQLLVNDAGKSTISIEDFAVAVLDQLEQGAHVGERISVAN